MELKAVAKNSPPDLIGELIPSRAVITFAGSAGIGKSMTTLSWAASIAQGINWFGQAVTAPQKVVYILGEGFNRFGDRAAAWEEVNNVELGENLHYVDGGRQGINLIDPSSLEETMEHLREISPALVIFDTFSMLAQVKSENDNAEVAKVYLAAHRIVQEIQASVLLVHHASKDGEVRGATAFRGNSDTVIVARKGSRQDVNDFYLSTRNSDDGKQRDGEPIKLDGFTIESPGVLTRSAITIEEKASWENLNQLAQQAQLQSA